jgi:Zn-dependent peptidase ImmA (M78 family)
MSKVSTYLQALPLSADEIALKARLPTERVRVILEGGDATLSDLRALSRALKVPLRSFASEPPATADLRMLFRSSTASRPDRGVEAAATFVQGALQILPRREAPPPWLSSFTFDKESYADAARLADEFRSRFVPNAPDDPLVDLPHIITQLCDVILARLETSRFEGASVIADGYPFIFVSTRFSGRMLFTLAHEIGHLLTHHQENRSVVFDRASQIGDPRRQFNRSEAFVNAFASVLLLPASGVGKFLQNVRQLLHIEQDAIGDVEILYLARFFGVSFDVAAWRCENLELLPPGGAKSLSEHLRDRHGGPEKRASSLRLPERPSIAIPRVSNNLLRIAAEKVKRGDISAGWVTDRFGCSISELYSLNSDEAKRGSHH